MMSATQFEFLAPTSLDAALSAIDSYGSRARLLSGGMSLMPIMNLGLAEPEAIVSLNRVSELSQIVDDENEVRVGAMVRHAEVASDAVVRRFFPALASAASRIGDVQVRNRGTIGGSIAHADPSADYAPVLAALDAVVTTRGTSGPLDHRYRDFVIGVMETRLQPNEILTEIRLPKSQDSRRSAYVRLARVEGSFAIANAAATGTGDDVTLAIGAVRPAPVVIPVHLDGATGSDVDDRVATAVEEALASGSAVDDETSRYREAMGVVCARRAVEALRR